MKTFIKNVLLFLVLMIFVTMLFQGATSQTSNQKNEAEDNISLIEENIENGNIVNDGVNIQEENTQGSNTHSFLSGTPDVKRSEMNRSEIEQYRALIEENIDYDILLEEMPYEQERLEEIVGLMTDTVCSSRSHIRVAGSDFPAEVVKSRLLKLNAEHIRFVFDCLKKNTTEIRNIRQYLLTALYNAPVSINSHYAAQVNHDLYGGW